MPQAPLRIIDGDSKIFVPENGEAKLKFRTVFDYGWPNLESVEPDAWEADFLIPGVTFENGVLTVSSEVGIETEHLVIIRAKKGDQVDEIPVRIIKRKSTESSPPASSSIVEELLLEKRKIAEGQLSDIRGITQVLDKIIDAVIMISNRGMP